MAKYLACILLLFLLSFFVSVQYREHSQDTISNPYDPSAALSSSANGQQVNQHTTKSEWNPPRWYRLFGWPDGITVWAVLLTLVAIAEQAKEASVASRAAAHTTETFVQSERAWIIINPIEVAPELMAVETGTSPGNGIRLSVKNAGKGIARIDNMAISYKLLTKEEWRKLSTEPFKDGKAQDYYGLVLVPTDSLPLECDLEPSCLLTQDQANSIKRGDEILFASGTVNYRDGFGIARYTRFGYKYHFPQGGLVSIEKTSFRREPPGYNEAA